MIFSFIKTFQKLQAMRKSISPATLQGIKKKRNVSPSYLNDVSNNVSTVDCPGVCTRLYKTQAIQILNNNLVIWNVVSLKKVIFSIV